MAFAARYRTRQAAWWVTLRRFIWPRARRAFRPLCELGEFEVITGDPFFGLSVEKGDDQRSGGRRAGSES